MGTFNNTTVQTDGGGNDRGSTGAGEAYDPLPVSELHEVTHVLEWVPGANEVVVSEEVVSAGDTVDAGISMATNGGSCTISGRYLDLFPTVFFEWTLPPADTFTPPSYATGTRWSDLPAPADSNLTQFDTYPVQDKTGTYVYTVNWKNTSSGATGADVVTLTEKVYMDFWLHESETKARAI